MISPKSILFLYHLPAILLTQLGLEEPEEVEGDGAVERRAEVPALRHGVGVLLAHGLLVLDVGRRAEAVVVVEDDVPAVGGGAADRGLEAAGEKEQLVVGNSAALFLLKE